MNIENEKMVDDLIEGRGTHTDDLRLVAAAHRGDLAAFNKLVERYQTIAYHTAYRVLGNREMAEDATQNAFLSAYTSLHQFAGGSFRAWFLRIVTNGCIDLLRWHARRPTTRIGMVDEDEDGEGFDPADTDPLPEDYALSHELQASIQQGLQALTVDQRIAVILSDVEGLSYKEIAEVTGVSVSVVKTRLHRARMHLRKILLHRSDTRALLPSRYLQAAC